MDYCARESTLEPCCDGVKETTILMSIRETFKILGEMDAMLQDFAQIINGETHEEKKQLNAGSMWEEARLMTALAYENLQTLKEIKKSII